MPHLPRADVTSTYKRTMKSKTCCFAHAQEGRGWAHLPGPAQLALVADEGQTVLLGVVEPALSAAVALLVNAQLRLELLPQNAL